MERWLTLSCLGVDLHDYWNGDARAYNGITVPGFKNLCITYGPNTNS